MRTAADPDALAAHYQQCGIPKHVPRKKAKAKKGRVQIKGTHEIHDYVFGRERQMCRVTRPQRAESMHELRPRSLGGKVSRKNSVAVQGDGVNGIHGLLQRHEIGYEFETPEIGAEGTVIFTAFTQAAADAMRVKVGESIVSAPMVVMEAAV